MCSFSGEFPLPAEGEDLTLQRAEEGAQAAFRRTAPSAEAQVTTGPRNLTEAGRERRKDKHMDMKKPRQVAWARFEEACLQLSIPEPQHIRSHVQQREHWLVLIGWLCR